MISSISSQSTALSMQRSNAAQQKPPPPPDKDLFKAADSDSNGLVSESELSSLVEAMQETGALDSSGDVSLSTYDSNQDGGLSGEELLDMLTANGFQPPQMEDGQAGPPPPPPSSSLAMEAYANNSTDDIISQIIAALQGDDGSSAETTGSIDIVS